MADGGITSKIAEPYAEALMSLAKANDLTDAFGDNAAALISLLDESEDLRDLLASPVVSADVKKSVLQQLLGDQVNPLMKNFLMLLVDHRRIIFLKDICLRYQQLLRELKRAVLAQVVSAVELTPDQKQTVSDKVKELTGAQFVELESKLDPSVLGGVVIQVGSQIFDLSLRGQLRRLALQLANANA
jgi:F-type H+-transporting ATPase subunit delta